MIRFRVVLLAAVFGLALVTGLFGQARDFEPPTPDDDIKDVTGEKPDLREDTAEQYAPRQVRNPAESGREGPWRGRMPFVAINGEYTPPRPGQRDLHEVFGQTGEPVVIPPPDFAGRDGVDDRLVMLDLDQYMIDFEVDTPRWIQVTAPDGTPKIYWYVLWRAINWDTFPVRSHVSFAVKTEVQDLHSEPQLTLEQIQEQNQELLRQFAGEPGRDGSLEARGLEQYRDEILRGIRRSLTNNYLNFSDRALMDAICNKERLWEEDAHGRLYNSLVPAHHLQWRKRLLVVDAYSYAPFVVVDHKTGDAYIIRLEYVAPGGPGASAYRDQNVTVRKMAKNGDAPEVIAQSTGLRGFLDGQGRQIRITPRPESPMSEPDPNNLPTLSEMILRFIPRYHKGDRVDMYGFRLKAGHPDYERGVLINSDFTIATRLWGSRYLDIDFNDPESSYYRMEDIGSQRVTVAHATGPESLSLPEAGGMKLVHPPVESMIDVALTLKTLFSLEDPPPGVADLKGQLETYVNNIAKAAADGIPDEEQYRRDFTELISRLIGIYERDVQSGNRSLPDVVFFDIERLIVRQSRLYFAEAHNQDARLIGRRANGFLWDARYYPAECYVKAPAPRRYQADQNVLRNYPIPAETVWRMPGDENFGQEMNRAIGEDQPDNPRLMVNGVILDDYEYDNDGLDEPTLPASGINRFGEDGGRSYGGAVVEVGRGEPYFDNTWDRDGGEGRPVKRIDHYGRPMNDGYLYYRPGDRVTPMEWWAYGSLTPVNILRDYEQAGGYAPQRGYLREGDLLVGQPRLILAQFRFEEEDVLGERALRPKGQFIGDRLPHNQEVLVDGDTCWRHGFRCDPAGCYDGVIYEQLPPGKQGQFDQWVQNTVDLINAQREARVNPDAPFDFDDFLGRDYLRPVPVMDRRGAPADFVNPLTNEKIPQRFVAPGGDAYRHVLPQPDQPVEFLRDTGGNVMFAKRYEMFPRYIHEYDYEAISESEAEANETVQGDARFEVQRYQEAAALANMVKLASQARHESRDKILDELDRSIERLMRDDGGYPDWRAWQDAAETLRRGGRVNERDLPGVLSLSAPPQEPVLDTNHFWSQDRTDTPYVDHMAGLYKADDRPTLQAAEILLHEEGEMEILVDRSYIKEIIHKNEDDQFNPDRREYTALVVTSNRGVGRILGREEEDGRTRFQTWHDETWRHRNVVYLGEIVDDTRRHEVVFMVRKEIRPAIAEGVAIFGELDNQWDFLNVYVSGIKGPLRRDGLNSVEYQTIPSNGDGTVQRTEFSPQFVEENWMLMLRFNRPGDEFEVANDRITFVRHYWYLDRSTEPMQLRD